MIDEGSPIAELRDAVQKFAMAQAGKSVIVDVAVVLYEIIEMDESGRVGRSVKYAIPTDNFSLSTGMGLLAIGRHYMSADLFGDDDVD